MSLVFLDAAVTFFAYRPDAGLRRFSKAQIITSLLRTRGSLQQLESSSAARTRPGEVARGVNPPQKQRLQFLYRLEPGLKALANL
jgi:hypothetical protein